MPQFSFEAIGTHWTIDIYESISVEKENELREKVLNRIAEFDKNYSRFRKDSWINELSLKAGTYNLPADAEPMFSLYRDFYKLTDGLLTPLIGQLLVDAGYDAEYSLAQNKPLSKPPSWDEVIDYHPPQITL